MIVKKKIVKKKIVKRYNIGIIYKCVGERRKSKEYLEKCLNVRAKQVGLNPFLIAQVQEALGKMYMEDSGY